MIKRIYTFLAAALVRALVAYCKARGRYVDYVHSEPLPYSAFQNFAERVYMRRYVVSGFMTGDPEPLKMYRALVASGALWISSRLAWAAFVQWIRFKLPNLYVHHMHHPDADECLHDHPWPWGVSFVLLGGYRETRLATKAERARSTNWQPSRWLHAPAINVLRGTTFHRVSELANPGHWGGQRGSLKMPGGCSGSCTGTWTLFLAGPRAKAKAWGYLVPGRGFVPQRERHAEVGAREVRGEERYKCARGNALDALASVYGIERKRYGWWIFTLEERDSALRKRCLAIHTDINARVHEDYRTRVTEAFRSWLGQQ